LDRLLRVKGLPRHARPDPRRGLFEVFTGGSLQLPLAHLLGFLGGHPNVPMPRIILKIFCEFMRRPAYAEHQKVRDVIQNRGDLLIEFLQLMLLMRFMMLSGKRPRFMHIGL
jgi:hypothetical protein